MLLFCFYLYFRQSREQTLVIIGQAVNSRAISSSLSPCLLMLAGPRLSSIHVTAHCGPNELPEAQAEYLMRLLSVNGYCDQRRVPVHLAEGLHNSWPYCWASEPCGRRPSGARCRGSGPLPGASHQALVTRPTASLPLGAVCQPPACVGSSSGFAHLIGSVWGDCVGHAKEGG